MSIKNTKKQLCVFILFFMTLSLNNQLIAQDYDYRESSITQVVLKNNIAYDAAMIPNIGLELYLEQNWSLSYSWMFAWWENDAKHRFWHIYGGEIEAKKWIGRRADKYKMEGHHLGGYIMAGTYDFEWGHGGEMSNISLNVGISYGYTVRIAKEWYLDFGLGMGYVTGTYKKYKPTDYCYCLTKTKKRNYFGPSKAEITLIWSVGGYFDTKLKGGRK